MDPMWLNCDISRGMFPNEKAVCIETNERKVSFFLPTKQVRSENSNNGQGEIRVEIIDLYEQSALVFLPRPPFEGNRVIEVSREHLRK